MAVEPARKKSVRFLAAVTRLLKPPFWLQVALFSLRR